jgi:hypothetical protein
MSKNKTSVSQLVIFYPMGGQQIIKPNAQFFQGDWASLAEAVGRPYYPYNVPVKYETR